MPRVIEPSGPKAGPLGMRHKSGAHESRNSGKPSVSRSTKTASSMMVSRETPLKAASIHATTKKKTYIGEDLLRVLDCSSHRSPSPSHRLAGSRGHVSKAGPIKNGSAACLLGTIEPESILNQRDDTVLSSRALALDTRFLELSDGDPSLHNNQSTAAAMTTTNHYRDFVHTLAVRGACPILVATTTLAATKRSSKLGRTILPAHAPAGDGGVATKVYRLKSHAALLAVLESQPSFLNHVPIQPLQTGMNGALSIPLAVSAESSWKLFGNMVESLLSEYNLRNTRQSALDITIFTTDVALFCDTNVDSHAQALKCFVHRLTPFFSNSQLKSIQIQTFITGTLQLQQQVEVGDEMNCEPTVDNTDETSTTSKNVHQVEMTKCIQTIDSIFDKWEFSCSSRQGDTAAVHDSGMSVDMTHSLMECSSICFKVLSRQWIRDAFASRHLRCRLKFDLPATADGTQCSVELDATYQILPFAIDSPQAKMMLNDLSMLSELTIRVVQLIPLATIDASLLYGIPMKVCSSLGNNSDEFREMEFLVRSLFGLLQERELVLLLRGTPKARRESLSNSTSKFGFFESHTSSLDSLFLLMPQEVPIAAGNSPTSGVLHRIAHSDHFLADVSPVSSKSNEASAYSETESQYTEYVDAAFAEIELLPFNPLTLAFRESPPHVQHCNGGEHATKIQSSLSPPSTAGTTVSLVAHQDFADPAEESDTCPDMEEPVSSVWSDTAGVGACCPSSSQVALFEGETNDMDGEAATAASVSRFWNASTGIGACGPSSSHDSMFDIDNEDEDDNCDVSLSEK